MTFTSRGLYASSSKVAGKRRFGWLFLGVLLAVAALLYGAAAAASFITSVDAQRSDEYPGVTALTIENGTAGNVEIVGTDGDTLTVSRTLRSNLMSNPEEGMTERGEELLAEADCSGTRWWSSCRVSYEVEVPEGVSVTVEAGSGQVAVEGTRGDVTVTTTSGRVELEDVEGNADLETTSGSIDASGSGEEIRARSNSGSVELEEFTAGTVDVATTSGSVSVEGGFDTLDATTTSGGMSIEATEAFQRIVAASTSGAISMEVPEGTYAVTGGSTSGSRDIDLDTSPDASAEIDATTTSGAVDISSSD